MAPRIFAKAASLSIQNPSLLRAHPYLQGIAPKVQIRKARSLHSSAILTKDSSTALGPSSPNSHAHSHERTGGGDTSPEAFSIFKQLREVRPATRYVVYAGLGLMATVESTFWFHVLRAKFFPRAEREAQRGDDELSRRVSEAVGNSRHVWMANYRRYYSTYVWGASYGGLDGVDEEQDHAWHVLSERHVGNVSD